MTTGSKVEIIPYDKKYNRAFRELNVAWLEKYFSVEPLDEEIFSDPQKYILDKGGRIYFAKAENEIIGTFAWLHSNGEYELAKMAVREDYQGKKIGNALLEFCIEEAGRSGLKKLVLYSNTLLGPAIHLYKKYGFKEVPLENSHYKRSNIKMELAI